MIREQLAETAPISIAVFVYGLMYVARSHPGSGAGGLELEIGVGGIVDLALLTLAVATVVGVIASTR